MAASSPLSPVTASSPGKVLLCGGYLVLQSATPPGLVVATSSRFFSSAFAEEAGEADGAGAGAGAGSDAARAGTGRPSRRGKRVRLLRGGVFTAFLLPLRPLSHADIPCRNVTLWSSAPA